MEARIKMFGDGGNRLTKIMEETHKPFDFPTMIAEPEIDLNYGLNFGFDGLAAGEKFARVELDNLLVEISKDGVSLGKKLVGNSAAHLGLLIRDRNRYQEKAIDEVIIFSLLAGVGFNLAKTNRNHQKVEFTINQPLIEYAKNRNKFAMKYIENLKGGVRATFYNTYDTDEVIAQVDFEIEKVNLCPEAIAAFFRHAVNDDGTIKHEFRKKKKTIVWDIGSGQTNVAAFEGLKIVGINTFDKGMFDCYEKISAIMYNNYREKMDRKLYSSEIDDIIRFEGGIAKMKKGEDINISGIVSNVFDLFAYEQSKDLREFSKLKFMGNCDNVIFAGGGSKILFDQLDRYLGNDFRCIKSETSEFDNVFGSMYYQMYKEYRMGLEG